MTKKIVFAYSHNYLKIGGFQENFGGREIGSESREKDLIPMLTSRLIHLLRTYREGIFKIKK